MPEEYSIIFNALKAGMTPDKDEMENFNRMIEEKSVKNGGSIATAAQYKEMNKQFVDTIKKSKEPVQARKAGERPRMLFCP